MLQEWEQQQRAGFDKPVQHVSSFQYDQQLQAVESLNQMFAA